MSKRKPIYNPQLRPTNDGSDTRRGLKKAVIPSQKVISVQDIPDYSTPAGASMANEEMRRLRDGLNKVQATVQAAGGGNSAGGSTTSGGSPSGSTNGTNGEVGKPGKDGKDGTTFPWAFTMQMNGGNIGKPKVIQVLNILNLGEKKFRRPPDEPLRNIATVSYDINWEFRNKPGDLQIVTDDEKREVEARAYVALPDFNKYMMFSQLHTPFSVAAYLHGGQQDDGYTSGYADGTHYLQIYLHGDRDLEQSRKNNEEYIWVYSQWDRKAIEDQIAGDPVKWHGNGWRRIKVPDTNAPTNGDQSLEFVQTTPALIWDIPHTLTKIPNVTTVDSFGVEMKGQIVYPNATTVQVKFSVAVSGKAYLN